MRSINEVKVSVTLVGWSMTFLRLNLLKRVGSVLDLKNLYPDFQVEG